MIRLQDIRFRYNARYVLDGLDFSIGLGDRVGLVGPNGSGKTTLCHIVMGLSFPESGTVEIFGKNRVKETDFSEIRGRIGFLFQDADDQLFCPTVLEDVAFGPLNMGKTPADAKRIVRATLTTLRLDGFEDRITYKLSGGEKRLVSLATVLAMEPEILILDEPTNGLDEETTERIIEILNGLQLSYIVISHDREFVNRTTNKLFRIAKGKIAPA
ncbi:MAG: ABC transporter ATP-binding protein [Desulfomonile tiedjei]|uniref:ABC transporter ATP-binding protein n=1 Tax=Desulfomonile tiedjei TaxID=2358 RepID=A0A9D6Z0Z6_9BACT|nr:ABC transporter ATP-binding protein [Desulfomonile tiedjei]